MSIIKLGAIDSTNSYLKKVLAENTLENFTIVTADYQTEGRGQMGTVWESDNDKNLTFSLLINFDSFEASHQFYLSMAVALGVLNALKSNVNSLLYVKWPNDILAEKDKICGILIENALSGFYIKHAIVGIGLNVNQELFSEDIPNVTSMKKISGVYFDRDEILQQVVKSIQFYVQFIYEERFEDLKKMYLASLYKFKVPSMFEDAEGTVFLGKIINVSEEGRLIVELENETTRNFNLKEIKFASR